MKLANLLHLGHKEDTEKTFRGTWLKAEATVLCAEWREGDQSDFCHYCVSYSYTVDGAEYTGESCDYIDQQQTYLEPGETITIHYCQENPSTSYYPEAAGSMNQRLLNCGLGAGTGLI